ncbi:Altered inheritance of mitochondria protein 9, mitochondrial [Mycena indigotica]|uniref:Altered inheritance of mitochondria protein 9, mitochondrial n=1 Tax=Mycena indigotica TaxID=2126181 RepID=A0A8H6SB32_9AGAR|nr:Altered inheritance of mitochondria protein 9, mitochondrial [Mycena indigotica]KAF7294595.1 Altered inheritance of mitochondria protein 9, mitochondrial [Mycena indigotica]
MIRRLFSEATAPWEGETHNLKALLVETAEHWGKLAPGICPVEFSADDVHVTKALSQELRLVDQNVRDIQSLIGFQGETWVPSDYHKTAKSMAKLLKLKVLMALPMGELRDNVAANWFLDDMDEGEYS